MDIWVIPACFLRHNGLARIRRVAKSMKIKVERVTWLAKGQYLYDVHKTHPLVHISSN